MVIIYITNIIKSFLIAYYFIILKSANIFIFINKYIRELFFYNFCLGPIVIFKDFTIGLIAVIVIKKKVSINKIGIKVTNKLTIRLNKVNNNLFL